MTIPVNGFLAVYLSNATSFAQCDHCSMSEGDVYFDHLKIKFSRGHLKEETHYYPFGLPMAGMGSSAMGMTPNRQKYQSNEYITDAGLNWMSFGARQYDPQLGRFLSVDPMASQGGQDMLSPYQAMGNNPVSMTDPGGTTYANIDDLYIDNKTMAHVYLSPGTIAFLGLPWTGLPDGLVPPPNWDYGAFFDLSADIATAEFYRTGMSRLYEKIQQSKDEKNNNFTAGDMALIRAFYDQMPDGSKAVFYANHTYTYDPNYVLVHGRLDGSDLIAGIGPGGGVFGGVLRMFGLDDPLTLILMPGSLSDGMTPAQAAAFFQREQSAWNQFEESKAILRGAGWMFSKGGKRNIWPDQYGYPPNPSRVDWNKSDSQLADELSAKNGDNQKGPGTANNKAKKWFRDKRPK